MTKKYSVKKKGTENKFVAYIDEELKLATVLLSGKIVSKPMEKLEVNSMGMTIGEFNKEYEIIEEIPEE